MKILVTGAKGFVGKNLCAALQNVADGKDKSRGLDNDIEIMPFDIDTDPALLSEYCQKADFVFNLAGVNRPETEEEFMKGNFGFASELLNELKKHNNKCPVMLSSSLQATPNAPIRGRASVPQRIFFSCSPPKVLGRIRTPFLTKRAPHPFGP